MQVSLKWINELVNIESVNLEDLINKLTLGGFEVEEVIQRKIELQPLYTGNNTLISNSCS